VLHIVNSFHEGLERFERLRRCPKELTLPWWRWTRRAPTSWRMERPRGRFTRIPTPPHQPPIYEEETLDEEEIKSGKLKKATVEDRLNRAVKETRVSIAEPEETNAADKDNDVRRVHAGNGVGRDLHSAIRHG
jgi:hypothetical protein